MLLWLDTINFEAIQMATDLGILYGITTNPLILSESKEPLKTLLGELLNHQDGPLAVQVVAEDIAGMVKQGQDLYSFSDRIIVKVPVTKSGLEAIHLLNEKEIPTMATTVFYPHQAFMAAQVGAKYIAPYLSHIDKSGRSALETLDAMQRILKSNDMQTDILAASVNSLEMFQACAQRGIPHITVKDTLFYQLTDTASQTQEWVDKFTKAFANLDTPFLSCK
ncbi:MAG: hypothetical protein H0X51_05015 [Parachlamydiaceae bacterium]|nr:hypothetical protein [Parachlamydiaceae bacterium]